jgi:hypothetical protein
MQAIVYPDRRLMLIGIPPWGFLLRHIGEPAALSELLYDVQYYLDLAYAIVVTGIVWQINRLLVMQMDRQFSWATHSLQRFFVQGLLAYGLSFLFMLLISFLYNELIIQRPVGFEINNVLSADLPGILLFVTITHLLYTGMWMVQYHRHTLQYLQQKLAYVKQVNKAVAVVEKQSVEEYKKTLLVEQDGGFVPLTIAQIAYLFKSADGIVVRSHSGDTFLIDGTLEQLADQLPVQDFFRISRQFIIQKGAVRRVEGERSGRLQLQLQPQHSSQVTVSRRRAGDFRQWMEA